MPRNQGAVSVYFDLAIKAELERRATAAGVTLSHYIKLIVLKALVKGAG